MDEMCYIDDDGTHVPLTQDGDDLWSDPSGHRYRIWNATAIRLYDGLDTATSFPLSS